MLIEQSGSLLFLSEKTLSPCSMGMQPMKEAVTTTHGFLAVMKQEQPNKVPEKILTRKS